MNKYILISTILVNCHIIAQNAEIINNDSFDSDKNHWSFNPSDDWNCSIGNGKLNMQIKKNFEQIWLIANGIDDLANKVYTEITYDFDIQNTYDYFGTGMIFVNELNSREFESVKLVLNKQNSYFIKESASYPDSFFYFGISDSPIFKSKNNTVKIIFDNREDEEKEKGSQTKVFINGELVVESEWNISNFNKIGFIVSGNNKIQYDNLVIKQDNTINFVDDVFDFIYVDGKLEIDNNGVNLEDLIKYIPIEMVATQNILSTDELIGQLKANKKCSNFEITKRNFGNATREAFSFTYGNSIIEFFIDTIRPNPYKVQFLSEKELNDFFKVFSDYNSYRYNNDQRAQWPSQPMYSIDKSVEYMEANIWRGFQ